MWCFLNCNASFLLASGPPVSLLAPLVTIYIRFHLEISFDTLFFFFSCMAMNRNLYGILSSSLMRCQCIFLLFSFNCLQIFFFCLSMSPTVQYTFFFFSVFIFVWICNSSSTYLEAFLYVIFLNFHPTVLLHFFLCDLLWFSYSHIHSLFLFLPFFMLHCLSGPVFLLAVSFSPFPLPDLLIKTSGLFSWWLYRKEKTTKGASMFLPDGWWNLVKPACRNALLPLKSYVAAVSSDILSSLVCRVDGVSSFIASLPFTCEKGPVPEGGMYFPFRTALRSLYYLESLNQYHLW